MADGAGLAQADPDPGEREFGQQQQGQAVRQGLDELELRFTHERQHALGDLLVVDRVCDRVALCRARAVGGKLQIDDDGLPDAPLPVDEADDALAFQSAQEQPVIAAGGHEAPIDAGNGECGPVCGGCSSASGQRARTFRAASSRSPARRRSNPATAIIAALSVQYSGRGKNACPPRAATSRRRRSRNSRLAPTPPATTSCFRPVASRARGAFTARVSTIASCRPRAISARRCSSRGRARTASDTAVLRPGKLNSYPARSSIGRGSGQAPGRPAAASRASCGPPGYGSPRGLALLSKASPAASSRVSPSRREA